jgi:hypothetical protein
MVKKLLFIVMVSSLISTKGTFGADPITVNSDPQLDAQSEIAQAAEQFDRFAWLMPKVIEAKLEAFSKRGFKAILLPDAETQPDEELMIDALVKGLQALGNSLSEDLQPARRTVDQLPLNQESPS